MRQIVYSPLAQGVLTGRSRPGQDLPEGSRAADARVNRFIGRFLLEDALREESGRRLAELAQGLGVSTSQLALAFCLRRPELASVIVGATSPGQLADNVAAASLRLDAATLRAVDELFLHEVRADKVRAMNVLVVGSGGREHALCWKIAQSPLVTKVHCAPGNAGIAELAQTWPVAAEDLDGIVALAQQLDAGLVVVGPEGPLCAGLVDALTSAGLRAFGPTKKAAAIEGDKVFARELCRRHRIPGPQPLDLDEVRQALGFLDDREDGPIVIKAAGLAAGKGVVVAKNNEEARPAVRACLESRRFGEAGTRIVIEECLEGPEVSMIVLTDSRTIVPLDSAQDHKRALDHDKGPNTGGMGAYSPVPSGGCRRALARADRGARISFLPTVHAMNREGRPFSGFLYAGLMLTPLGPRMLEFNCRLRNPDPAAPRAV